MPIEDDAMTGTGGDYVGAVRCGSRGSSGIASPLHATPTDESTVVGGGSGSSERMSTIALLHGALSALSLTDKCALSLSLGSTGGAGNRTPLSDTDFEVQSVLSETDKESLDLAMSMMGPQELTAVEEEVSRCDDDDGDVSYEWCHSNVVYLSSLGASNSKQRSYLATPQELHQLAGCCAYSASCMEGAEGRIQPPHRPQHVCGWRRWVWS